MVVDGYANITPKHAENLRAQITALVHAIQPGDALEYQHCAETLTWIASGVELCRIQQPATPPQHLVSYAVVYDSAEPQLLLVDHKKAGLWLPSGGHVEPGEHPADTVQREAHEELCLAAQFMFAEPIFLTVTQTIGRTAGHTDVSLWYVLRGTAGMPLQFDPQEFHRIAWFPLAALPLERSDSHMARFAAKLARMAAQLG